LAFFHNIDARISSAESLLIVRHRLAVYFQMPLFQIHDPIVGDAVASIHACLFATIVAEGGIADFDDEQCGARMVGAGPWGPFNNCNIGLGLGIRVQIEGRLDANPARRAKCHPQRIRDSGYAKDMIVLLWRHFDDLPVDQLNPLVPEKAEIGHLVILFDRPTSGFPFHRLHGDRLFRALDRW